MRTKNLFLSTAIAITALFISCNEPEQRPAEPPFLRVQPANISVPFGASEQSILITSNAVWEISISNDADWFTIDRMQGENTMRLQVGIEANPMAQERTAVITITSGALSASVTLTQAGTSPRLSTYPNFINAGGMGDLPGARVEYTLNVTSNAQWTAQVIDAELQEWISIAPTSGIGDGVITITLDPNIRFARRHAFISVSADGIQRRDTVFQRAISSLPADQFNSVTINGITWATTNVNEFGTFVHFSEPHNPGRYFQFNRPTAYSIVDGNITPPLKYSEIVEDSDWSILNDPCPCGWRVPTDAEMNTLRQSGFRWVNEPRGAWLGTDAQTATFDTPGNAIFLPAGGVFSNGAMHQLGIEGGHWTSTQLRRDDSWVLFFTQSGVRQGVSLIKRNTIPIRCVLE